MESRGSKGASVNKMPGVLFSELPDFSGGQYRKATDSSEWSGYQYFVGWQTIIPYDCQVARPSDPQTSDLI